MQKGVNSYIGPKKEYNPLIWFLNKIYKKKWNRNVKGFPEGFEYFGPRIRIPREKLSIWQAVNVWKPPISSKITKFSFEIICV